MLIHLVESEQSPQVYCVGRNTEKGIHQRHARVLQPKGMHIDSV